MFYFPSWLRDHANQVGSTRTKDCFKFLTEDYRNELTPRKCNNQESRCGKSSPKCHIPALRTCDNPVSRCDNLGVKVQQIIVTPVRRQSVRQSNPPGVTIRRPGVVTFQPGVAFLQPGVAGVTRNRIDQYHNRVRRRTTSRPANLHAVIGILEMTPNGTNIIRNISYAKMTSCAGK